LYPPPVDLTVHANLHPEGNLFYWVTSGIPDTAMPAWQDKMSETERWQVVEYIRSFSPRAGFTPQP
jgi:mono/diheme cytochrome c family protein